MSKVTPSESINLYCESCREPSNLFELDKKPYHAKNQDGVVACPKCGSVFRLIAYVEGGNN